MEVTEGRMAGDRRRCASSAGSTARFRRSSSRRCSTSRLATSRIVVDLRDMNYVSSAGLRSFIILAKHARSSNQHDRAVPACAKKSPRSSRSADCSTCSPSTTTWKRPSPRCRGSRIGLRHEQTSRRGVEAVSRAAAGAGRSCAARHPVLAPPQPRRRGRLQHRRAGGGAVRHRTGEDQPDLSSGGHRGSGDVHPGAADPAGGVHRPVPQRLSAAGAARRRHGRCTCSPTPAPASARSWRR